MGTQNDPKWGPKIDKKWGSKIDQNGDPKIDQNGEPKIDQNRDPKSIQNRSKLLDPEMSDSGYFVTVDIYTTSLLAHHEFCRTHKS